LKAEPIAHEVTPQLNNEQGINLETVYRSLLRIVARLDENEYTEGNSLLRQTEVRKHSDLANPASDGSTSQG
jgi:Fe2+ or Zn2+ uptake regulation protein